MAHSASVIWGLSRPFQQHQGATAFLITFW